MSVIKQLFGAGHFLGTPSSYVIHLSRGHVRHQGVGQAFWFRRGLAAISEVPVVDQELPVIFHAQTLDHQDVTIQIALTYRFADPTLAAQRLDFGVFPSGPTDSADGRTQAAAALTRLAQSAVIADVAGRALDGVLSDVTQAHATLTSGFNQDPRPKQMGIEIIDLHVLAIRPDSDVEKALQTPLREQLHTEADRATYERRALAVERERTISENELASKIELATRTQQLVAQEGANARRKAEEQAAANLIQTQSEAERSHIDAQAKASAIELTGQAEGARTASLMAAYVGIDTQVLKALALQDLAKALPQLHLGDVTITPDLLAKALSAWKS